MAHRVGVRMRIVRNQESHCVGYFSVRCMGRYDVMAPVHISPIKRLAPMHRSHGMESDSGVTADSLLRESTSCVSSLSAPGDTSTMCPRKRVRSRSGATAGSARSSATPARTIARRGVITSPPYYGLRTYGPDQWLRQWILGGPAQVSYDVGPQLTHRSRDAFIMELRAVWRNVAAFTSDDARLVVRFGAINSRPLDPIEVIEASLEKTPWHLSHIVSAGNAARGRRQATAFSVSRKPPLPEYDFWAAKTAT